MQFLASGQFLSFGQGPVTLLALAIVLLLGLEAWRRAAARARANRADALSALSELEVLRDHNWALAEREERYRDLVKTQGDVIFRKNLKGRVTYVNDVFCATFNKSQSAMMGVTFAPELPEGDTPRMLGAFSGSGTLPHRVHFDQRVMTAGGPRWFGWEEFALRDDEGKLREIQTVGRDITERKVIEERLAATLDEAQAANRAKGQFLAAMSHEIRTPMNGVLGMTSLLLDTRLTPAQRTYAEAVKSSGEALLAVINDILDYSKIEAGKFDIAEAAFDLRATIESVCELLSPRAFEKGLEIVAEVDPAVPLRLRGDEARIRQVLINLAGNAIKFTESGGVILRARAGSDMRADGFSDVVIEVEDTGIGIDAGAIDVIFDEFAQADQSLARRYEGTGLGLAISRRLVTTMGGTIGVESLPGRGSVFRVNFSLAAIEPAAPGSDMLNGLRLIIFDDRPVLAASLARVARLSGASVSCVSDAVMLMAALEAEPADIFLCPIDTDDGPGAELVARARSVVPDLKAVVLLRPQDRDRLSDLLGQAGKPQFFQRIFDGYLVRPVRASSFLARLDALAKDAAPADDWLEETGGQTPRTKPEWRARLNILVAEDNDVNALLARTLLERDGHNVRIARNGQDVLDALDQGKPADIVLMDLHMPGMDGFEATRRIRALADERSSVPIIALTANAMAEDRQTCLTAGMDDYISKPVSADALSAVLAAWAHRRSELGLAPHDARRANLP